MIEAVDALIVGAGPAGLKAAAELGQLGFRVLVVDEYPEPGGRLLGQSSPPGGARWDGRQVARQLTQQAEKAAARLCLGTPVYNLERGPDGFRARLGPASAAVAARTVLVATGATELPIPLPGWTLPGVLTVGGGQVLWSVYGVAPGRRGYIVGTGALSFAVAQELAAGGVQVAGIVLAPPGPERAHLGSVASQWDQLVAQRAGAPPWIRIGAAWLASSRRRRLSLAALPFGGVPAFGTRLRLGAAAVAIDGGQAVEAVTLRRMTAEGRLYGPVCQEPADFVLLSGGLRPLADLISAAGATMMVEGALGGAVPVLDPGGQTSVPGLFAAGSATGVEGAAVAMAQGALAGLAMARRLGAPVDDHRLTEARIAVGQVRSSARFSFRTGIEAARARVEAAWPGGGDGADPDA